MGLQRPVYAGMLYPGVFHGWFSLPEKEGQLGGFYRKGKQTSARHIQQLLPDICRSEAHFAWH